LKEKFKIINDDDYYLIRHLYTDIFESGKNLALLKLCDPNVYARIFDFFGFKFLKNNKKKSKLKKISDEWREKQFLEIKAKLSVFP
jgi:hypothetical protein